MKKPEFSHLFLVAVRVLLTALIAAAALSGCVNAAEPAQADQPDEAVSLPNPVVIADARTLADMGLPIEPPEDAVNAAYSVIDGEIAQVQFTYNGLSYIYRASRTKTDISGVYEQFRDEALTVEADYADFSLNVTVKSIVGGGELGTWSSDGVTFSLYVRSVIGAEEHAALCTTLGEAAHYAITGSGIEADVTAQYLKDTLGLYIDAPAGAESVNYTIYDDNIALVDFVFEDVSYQLRAVKKPSLLSFQKDDYLRVDTADMATDFYTGTMTLYYNDSLDALACWEIDGVSCQLYAKKYSDTASVFSLALRIATDAYLRTPVK